MGIKLYFKKVFCEHVYEEIERKTLNKPSECKCGDVDVALTCPIYNNYQQHAVKVKCLNCGKEFWKQEVR